MIRVSHIKLSVFPQDQRGVGEAACPVLIKLNDLAGLPAAPLVTGYLQGKSVSSVINIIIEHDPAPIRKHYPVHTCPIGHRSLSCNRPGLSRSEEHTSELQSRPHLVC